MVSCRVHRCPFTKEQWEAKAKEAEDALKQAQETGVAVMGEVQTSKPSDASSLSHKEE